MRVRCNPQSSSVAERLPGVLANPCAATENHYFSSSLSAASSSPRIFSSSPLDAFGRPAATGGGAGIARAISAVELILGSSRRRCRAPPIVKPCS